MNNKTSFLLSRGWLLYTKESSVSTPEGKNFERNIFLGLKYFLRLLDYTTSNLMQTQNQKKIKKKYPPMKTRRKQTWKRPGCGAESEVPDTDDPSLSRSPTRDSNSLFQPSALHGQIQNPHSPRPFRRHFKWQWRLIGQNPPTLVQC